MVSLINYLVRCLTMCCFLYTLVGLCDGGVDDINMVMNNIIEDRYPCSMGNYNYEDALGKGILFYEGQRSGKLPNDQRVKWRGDSALTDGQSDKATLVGGYYDAGDNVKFGWPMAFTITLLSWSAIEFQKEISSANQLSYLHQAIQWGTDFFLQAHVSSTTLYTQVGDANGDHQCWERPEDMDTPRTLYKITTSSPGTEAAAETAAALAAASVALKGVDSSYSTKLLNHAQSLFEFGDKHRGSYQASCPFYCSFSGYQDELLWAAAWLYKATRAAKYLNYVVSNQGWSSAVSELSWDNKYAGAQVLLAKEYLGGGNQDLKRFKSDADSFVCALMPGSSSVQIKTTPGGLLYTRDTGNLQYATTASMLLVIYAKSLPPSAQIKCGSKAFTPSQLESLAKSQIDYILGNNPMNMSYMVGFGTKYPQQPHHRGASIPSIRNLPSKVGCDLGYSNWYSSQEPNPNVHVGAIVGGPDSSDRFSDVRSDHAHLEPTTYLNAGFIGAVAGVMARSSYI